MKWAFTAVDIRRKDRKRLEEDPVAKRKDSIYLFDKHWNVAVIAAARNIPAIRHLLQHSRRSARRIDVLCGDEGKKASVKLDEIVIYWEWKANLKEKKTALKKAEKEVASLEAKKAKAEAVLKKLLASGMSADEILEKLK